MQIYFIAMNSLRLNFPISFYESKTIDDLNHQKGEISPDKSAVIGKSNWCFIYDGTNNYRQAYIDESLNKLGKQWIELINLRENTATRMGKEIINIIIPNKATLLNSLYPVKLPQEITFPLASILDSPLPSSLYIPFINESNEIKNLVFRRNDSHLTIVGNIHVATEIIRICTNFNEKLFKVDPIETNEVTHNGDLGGKFIPPISEKLHAPDWTKGLTNQKKITKTKQVIPTGHNGTKQSFMCEDAPIKKSILVFGNSFFEKVPSWGISPFIAPMFREYHFAWSSEIDWEYVKAVNPDIIVFQTCERFLTKIPVH